MSLHKGKICPYKSHECGARAGFVRCVRSDTQGSGVCTVRYASVRPPITQSDLRGSDTQGSQLQGPVTQSHNCRACVKTERGRGARRRSPWTVRDVGLAVTPSTASIRIIHGKRIVVCIVRPFVVADCTSGHPLITSVQSIYYYNIYSCNPSQKGTSCNRQSRSTSVPLRHPTASLRSSTPGICKYTRDMHIDKHCAVHTGSLGGKCVTRIIIRILVKVA